MFFKKFNNVNLEKYVLNIIFNFFKHIIKRNQLSVNHPLVIAH